VGSITDCYYEPWLGERYAAAQTLILSESAYSWTEDGEILQPAPSHPTDCVEWAIERFDEVPGSSYFGKMTRALCGRQDPSRSERLDAWNYYAYSIYIPRTVGEGAASPKTTAMWAAAKPQFQSLIARLQPRKIIVTGHEAWGKMPDECCAMLADNLQAYRLPSGKLAWCLAIAHPANRTNGFRWEEVAAQIKAFRGTTFPESL
jgi:hypothetical protein